MNIEFHPSFKRSYKSRIVKNKKLVEKTNERIKLFQQNQANPLLKDHALKGKKIGLRAFWVGGDIRIVYMPVSKNHALFLDIGTHNQVY